MRIGIHGSGKMGKAVEKVAAERGHQVTARFDSANPASPESLREVDVVIDFSTARALEGLIRAAGASGTPLVVGTTGWNERKDEIESLCRDVGIAMVYGSNFSPGANVVFELARAAAARFASFGNYECGVEERHHSRKMDSPSGTALRIASEVHEGSGGLLDPSPVSSRVGAEFGLHTLFFDSADDLVEISHRARSRDGFARGAVMAAERIPGMSGVHRFEDLISQEGEKQ
jgi:4-hydroxy-tetrahydrodipicolinate reductase